MFIAGARVLRTTYLTGAFASARLSIKKLVAAVTMPHCITLVLDGWSNINMESVWVFIALIPKIGAIILKSVNGSSASHTGEWYCGKDYSPGSSAGFSSAAMYDLFIVIAEQVDKVLIEYGPEHFGAIVSDNGGGCARGRRLVTDKYPHLLGHRWTPPASSSSSAELWLQTDIVCLSRCMMHGFALTMGSVFGHPWAAGILKACKAIVTTVTKSHNLRAWLKEQIKQLKKLPGYKHLTWLVQAATTRFTTMYNCMKSMLDLQLALTNVVKEHRVQLTNSDASDRQKALVKQVESWRFWAELTALTPLAEPFNKVGLS